MKNNKKKYRYNNILTNPIYVAHIKRIDDYELERQFCKHNLSHFIDVARLAYIYSLENSLDYDKDVIYAAALLHDIGRSKQYESGQSHNSEGIKLALPILYESGYQDSEIQMISDSILMHSSVDVLGEKSLAWLIAKADKDVRLCFLCDAMFQCKWEDKKKNKELM